MKSVRQILRQPVKLVVGVLLMALAGGVLCASVSQYFSAVVTRRQVENTYTTVGLPTTEYNKTVIEVDGMSTVAYTVDLPWEIYSFLTDLAQSNPDLIKGITQCGLNSAWCPDLSPLNVTQAGLLPDNGDGQSYVRTDPYTGAVLAVELTEIGEMTAALEGGAERCGYAVSLTGVITQVVALEEGYDDPTGRTLHITLRIDAPEALDALKLEVGGEYLVYGTDYTDQDWKLREDIAGALGSTQEEYAAFDWSNLIDPIEEWLRIFPDTAAMYHDPYTGREYPLSSEELDMVQACGLTVWDDPLVTIGYLGEDLIYFLDSAGGFTQMTTEEYAELYRRAGIVRLDGTVDELLSGEESELWEKALEATGITNHGLPVVTTDSLESVGQFAREEALVTQGRGFTDEEYQNGAAVCVISETLAAVNGLAVGDTIRMRFYLMDYNSGGSDGTLTCANPTAWSYSSVMGFGTEMLEYEIVGLYRQTNQWSADSYAFMPNTIFTPANSVSCAPEVIMGGSFLTLTLANGTQDEVEALIEEAGYGGLLVYYDQGYSAIQSGLTAYFRVSSVVLLAGLGTWLCLLLVFLWLFPLSQRRSAKRMWSLGASEKQIVRHVFAGGLALAVPGAALGAVLGVILEDYVSGSILSASEAELTLAGGPGIVIAAAALQLLLSTGAILLCGVWLAARLRKEG